ncbi:hypothetical protein GCK32_021722, partial [Trichostrongylus colubriformis]
IFASRSRPDGEASTGPDVGACDNNQPTQRLSQPAIRSRRPIIDEARFLEDIRKMKPKDTRETQTYYSHKMVLEAKDLLPRLGAAAIAEAQAAVERPARHFVGRPQPLITEDRGCVQPELTTYNRYRNYLGIVGPMPNIKPNIGPLTKLPAYLQALQQRNEMLGLASGGSTVRQVPAQPVPMNRPTQQPIQPGPPQRPYRYLPQQRTIHIPQSIPMPMTVRQAVQRMPLNNAARLSQGFYQRQRGDGWVEELERSALMSPTPPLTECDYPLYAGGDHYHCALSRKSADKTLSLTVEPTEKPPETPACTQELPPPDNNVWEPLEGPVDHVDCAEYYMRISSSAMKARKAASEKTKSVEEQREKGKGQEAKSIRNDSRMSYLYNYSRFNQSQEIADALFAPAVAKRLDSH